MVLMSKLALYIASPGCKFGKFSKADLRNLGQSALKCICSVVVTKYAVLDMGCSGDKGGKQASIFPLYPDSDSVTSS